MVVIAVRQGLVVVNERHVLVSVRKYEVVATAPHVLGGIGVASLPEISTDFAVVDASRAPK